jgi:membrane protein DedA with SNARE-associated domain/membrane-associated phospholipid phosphatase
MKDLEYNYILIELEVRVLNYVIDLFNHYGYMVLFISLLLELIAFPLPGEALMTYCGYVIYTNKMSWTISIIVAAIGAITGITISYFIGRVLGTSFFEKHGHYLHLDKKRIDKISIWFQAYGNKLLVMAYFIPGVRHVTGYFSGMTKIAYKKFAVSAYIGAFIWTATFISLGSVLGSNWDKYHSALTRYLVIISIIIVIIVAIIYIYRNYKKRIKELVTIILKNSFKIFNSFGEIKVLITGIAAMFLIFSALVIGIIQDYVANEFGEFDEIARYIVGRIFDERWNNPMKIFYRMSDSYILLMVTIITVIWILLKNINKVREIRFVLISSLGGNLLGMVLKNVFHRLGPSGNAYTFPSSEVLMSIVVYGLFAYMILKQSKKTWINSILMVICLSICFLIGLSIVYFNIQYPSDVAAGAEFGIVWLSLSIMLLEVYGVLQKLEDA